jgi:hypothetical protein
MRLQQRTQEIDEFYNQLQEVKGTVEKRDICITMGDLMSRLEKRLDEWDRSLWTRGEKSGRRETIKCFVKQMR